jgi:hypothetical protein
MRDYDIIDQISKKVKAVEIRRRLLNNPEAKRIIRAGQELVEGLG